MKKLKIFSMVAILGIAGYFVIAADHIDAPAVTNMATDITDFYAFEGADSDNMVFVANVQGLLSPDATANAKFDENVMIEINIDNNGDNVEDLVIQAVAQDGKMLFAGPVAPDMTGTSSKFQASERGSVDFVKISEFGKNAKIKKSSKGMSYFAGPRDDPFFFDFIQYNEILAGNATSFNDPGNDTFAGTNLLSVVVEVPKTLLGDGDGISSWVETKRKQ